MKILFLSIFSLSLIADANAFISSRKKEKLEKIAKQQELCSEIAIQYTYQSIQEKYSHWKYDKKDFSTSFSWVNPDDDSLVVHVKEKHYRFEHKIFLDQETCEVIGHESNAF